MMFQVKIATEMFVKDYTDSPVFCKCILYCNAEGVYSN